MNIHKGSIHETRIGCIFPEEEPMETFGKYFVIETSFHEAAHPEHPPYTSLGRLAYKSHKAGLYPIACTWRLIDYERICANESTRSIFQEILGLE